MAMAVLVESNLQTAEERAMSRVRRDFDAELGAIIEDLERQHVLVVARESMAAPHTDKAEISTKWVTSHTIKGLGNADARTHSTADTEA
jgi:hypothetical protein